MVLFTLIKKEIMQFFRNKTDTLTMFIFPIVLIVVMGAALSGLMNVDKNIFENKKIYYTTKNINNDEKYLQNFYNFQISCEENMKVKFEQTDNDNKARDLVNSREALAFITINKDGYFYYRSENKENSAQKIFKNIFEQYLEKQALIDTVGSQNPKLIQAIINEKSIIELKEEGINNNGIDSFTYYTFAELVLIILYISGITSISMYKENFQGTFTRLRMSKVRNLTVILSKVVLGLIVGIIQVIVIYFVSTVFLKINWGENLLQIFIVLISLIIFSSILGITASMIFDDNKTASSVINTLIIILGFLGGSYMPISLIKSTSITNILCQLTPTYWANISLLSLSTGLNTNYTYISIGVSLGLSIILIVIGSIIKKLKAGGILA
ncbi:MAG: ABC transporter permease [Peptostreptococcaceae bacterium]